MYQKIVKRIGDNHLYNGLKVTIACVIPFIFLNQGIDFTTAFILAAGSMLTAPVDIESSLKHKVVGLLSGNFIVAFNTFIIGVLLPYPILLLPTLALLIFLSSMIGIYGQRANLLSFSSLLSLALAFIHRDEEVSIYQVCLFLFLGGLIFTIVSLLFHFISPNRYVKIEIARCISKTADLLNLRYQLWNENINRENIVKKQLELQIKLNELHENIREYLVHNKIYEGNTANNRKFLISLSAVVEIMELSSANVFEHLKIIESYKDRPDLIEDYKKLAKDLSITLQSLSFHILSNQKYHSPVALTSDFSRLKQKFEEYKSENKMTISNEKILTFSNVLVYIEKQIEKVKNLERVYKERVNADELRGKYKDLEKFLTPQHYKFSILKENLNFNSNQFRHSLRITITLLLGYIIGILMPLQNEYWILLTIVVIMRPGYGLTKQRTKERILGTVFGGLIAFTLLFFVKNTHLLVTITIIAMIVGYWLSYSYYKIGVTFITIYVILIYGLIKPDYQNLLLYRVIDTVIGGFLAFATSHLLWPSWEFLKVKNHLKQAILGNRNYIIAINEYYKTKGEPTTEYKLARKQAYIEVGNLMSSFQRMTQEPKSKQKNKEELYQLAVLNQTLVTTSAGIGTYIQSHHTSTASQTFELVMQKIIANLEKSLKNLDKNFNQKTINKKEIQNVKITLYELKNIRRKEIEDIENETLQKQLLEESKLIFDQLLWMNNLSENIKKTTKKIKVDKKYLQKNK